MYILGIETSCDETGLAIYNSQTHQIQHVLHSQIEQHKRYGGVVPELASRDHILRIGALLNELLKKTNLSLKDINGIAYTAGPGLIGALLVGAGFAKSLSLALNIPAVAIHHMEGHLLTPLLENDPPPFPFLALLVSGGHTQIVCVKALGQYEILGETLDDAAGEAFDKIAKLMALDYPNGAALAKIASHGDHKRFHFPRPMTDRPGLDFSFSGLKTSVLNLYQSLNSPDEKTKADIACAFQDAVIETLVIKCKRAIDETQIQHLVVAGGVSANLHLREQLTALLHRHHGKVYFPHPEFCMDNGAMIAFAGFLRLQAGMKDNDLRIHAKARWEMDKINPYKG